MCCAYILRKTTFIRKTTDSADLSSSSIELTWQAEAAVFVSFRVDVSLLYADAVDAGFIGARAAYGRPLATLSGPAVGTGAMERRRPIHSQAHTGAAINTWLWIAGIFLAFSTSETWTKCFNRNAGVELLKDRLIKTRNKSTQTSKRYKSHEFVIKVFFCGKHTKKPKEGRFNLLLSHKAY